MDKNVILKYQHFQNLNNSFKYKYQATQSQLANLLLKNWAQHQFFGLLVNNRSSSDQEFKLLKNKPQSFDGNEIHNLYSNNRVSQNEISNLSANDNQKFPLLNLSFNCDN